MKKKLAALLVMTMGLSMALTACGGNSKTGTSVDLPADGAASSDTAAGDTTASDTAGGDTVSSDTASGDTASSDEKISLTVFIAASLNDAMTELSNSYMEGNPNVQISLNADSSGTLMTQIEEGAPCDMFFSAGQKQMDQLEKDGLLLKATREDALSNQVVVITWKGSGTKVTGLDTLIDASSIALADGSVPVGNYTRKALIANGTLDGSKDSSVYTTQEVSDALGGVTISEQSNVSKVLQTVAEGSCEVGTTYLSDLTGYEDKVEVLERISTDLTGDITYPLACIKNPDASDAQVQAANEFETYLLSTDSGEVFEKYGFTSLWNKR